VTGIFEHYRDLQSLDNIDRLDPVDRSMEVFGMRTSSALLTPESLIFQAPSLGFFPGEVIHRPSFSRVYRAANGGRSTYPRVTTRYKPSPERGEPSISLLRLLSTAEGIVVARALPFRRTDGLGIDLEKRGLEVRKLFYAAFARGLAKDGYDPEEALQEVYRGLLTRNKGTCPFDARKSSFGHYVHIVTRCILANYIRKEKRRLQFESTESSLSYLRNREDGTGFSIEGCPEYRTSRVPDPGSLEALSRSIGGDARTESALRLLSEGWSRREVLAKLGAEKKWLDGVLAMARATLSA